MPPKSTKDGSQLERMISIAYLLTTRDEIAIDELEERFSVNSAQIEDDLNQLMFCGLPPYSPDQLFDISIEDGFVSMFYNDVFVAPLKLNDSERTNATVALTRLKEESGTEESKQIDEILSIINSSQKQVLDVKNSSEHFDIFQKAIDEKNVVTITYLSLNSGSIDERDIEPKIIFTTASSSYIYAYCHRDKLMKLFRSDRITNVHLSDSSPISHEFDENLNLEIDNDDVVPFISSTNSYVVFKIEKQGQWIIDTYPVEVLDEMNNLYKIEISNPFVAARLILNAFPYINYVEGSFSKMEILNAVKTIKKRISE